MVYVFPLLVWPYAKILAERQVIRKNNADIVGVQAKFMKQE